MITLLLLNLAQPPVADPAVKAVTVAFDPTEAKPGQTVTLTLEVALRPGFYTYPTRQPDKAAADFVSKLSFPTTGGAVFVGEVADPADFTTKADPELGIKELRTLAGTVRWTRKLVVLPTQPAGPLAVTLPEVRLPVCTATGCLPPKKLRPSGTLTVLPGPAVAVEPAHAAAVRKALGGL